MDENDDIRRQALVVGMPPEARPHEPVVQRKLLFGSKVLKADIPSKVDFADCHTS